jgi:hypothetical protein
MLNSKLIIQLIFLITIDNLIVTATTTKTTVSKYWKHLNLPSNHLEYFFYSNPKALKKCLREDIKCPYINEAKQFQLQQPNQKKCWGYEKDCDQNHNNKLDLVECPGDSRGWVNFNLN